MTTDLISREAAIALLEKQKAEFLSERYAVGQPLSSLAERFAVDCCIEALTNMPSAGSGWRPIETAPKDETPILAFIPEESREYSFVYVLIYDELIPAWREAAGECYSQYVPSHWMPLPEPPQ